VTLLVFRYVTAAAVLMPLAFVKRRLSVEPIRLGRWILFSLLYIVSAFSFA
jgi:hypothetical protein